MSNETPAADASADDIQPASPDAAPTEDAGDFVQHRASGASSQAVAEEDAPPASHADELFDTSVTFADLGLHPDVVKGLDEHGFVHPTAIQAQIIRPILKGKDVIGQARTGTGKTAAFGLPFLTQAVGIADAEKEDPAPGPLGLVLAPTRELAHQIAAEIDALGKHTPVRTTTVVGGESSDSQRKSLKRASAGGGGLVVGTPGRVLDLHQRDQLDFRNIRLLALDEVDRMLDIGFRDDIRKTIQAIQKARGKGAGPLQTVFVSATVDPAIESLARQFMREDAEKIVTVAGSLTVAAVDQKYLSVEPWDKRALLLKLLKTEKPEVTVVFCRTKMTVRKVATYLKDKGLNAREIHGDMAQNKRNKVMQQLRKENVDILVASDLAARGLDVDHITHVVNYDLPEDPEVYIHRIGRTARAGRRGTAWTFVTPEQGQLLTEVEKLSGAMIEHLPYPAFKPGPVPSDIRDERARQRRKPDAPSKASDRAIGVASNLGDYTEEELKAMFPDGNIPTSLPPKNLSAKFRRRGR
ncbi:MAG: DEAD/DEAH box helicase [Planctomycetota bacterium]